MNVNVLLLVFLVSSFDCHLGLLNVCFGKLHPYCRLERDIAYKHTAQHRAISSALEATLGTLKSLVAPVHRRLISAPFTFSCRSEAGGVRQPKSETLKLVYYCVVRPWQPRNRDNGNPIHKSLIFWFLLIIQYIYDPVVV